jgi:hypothetical protein
MVPIATSFWRSQGRCRRKGKGTGTFPTFSSLPVTQKGAVMSRNTLIAVIIILLIIFGGWSFMGV